MGFKYANELKLYQKQTELDQKFYDKQQKQLNAWNQESAQKQMDFQKMMSSTAHQREVADLQKAGLNPVLSANNGAAMASGAYANVDSTPVSAASSSRVANKQISANMRMNELSLANAYKIAKYQAQMQMAMQKYATDMQYKLGLQQAQLQYNASIYGSDISAQNAKYTSDNSLAGTKYQVENNPGLYGTLLQLAQGVGSWFGAKNTQGNGAKGALDSLKAIPKFVWSLYSGMGNKIGNKMVTISAQRAKSLADQGFKTGDIGYIPQGQVIGKDGMPTGYKKFNVSVQHIPKNVSSKSGLSKMAHTHKSSYTNYYRYRYRK